MLCVLAAEAESACVLLPVWDIPWQQYEGEGGVAC